MPIFSRLREYFANWRPVSAVVFSLLAVSCLWVGFDVRLSIKTASAEQFGVDPAVTLNDDDDSFSQNNVAVLRAGVDSLALGMSGVFEILPTADAKRRALAKALDRLTFQNPGGVYFTAWEGTRMLHSPATPDTADMDFSAVIDANGKPFILQCNTIAGRGGGFTKVQLGRPEPGASPRNPEAMEQVVYTRPIPETDWHVIAFAPVVKNAKDANPLRADEDLRTGLRISGFSFAGLAGLVLVPSGRRREDD